MPTVFAQSGNDCPIYCRHFKLGRAGLVALVGGKNPGKTILLRADMDALPLQEEADVEYHSRNDGKMHGCGHDMHTAMLLGAAKLLKEHEAEIQGTVKLEFQPAEEIFQGSPDMLNAGLLEVTVKGKGGHGSTPHEAIDPITAAAHMHIALQEINSRELDGNQFGIFTAGRFEAGKTSNVIPDTAEMWGTTQRSDLMIPSCTAAARPTRTPPSAGWPSTANKDFDRKRPGPDACWQRVRVFFYVFCILIDAA